MSKSVIIKLTSSGPNVGPFKITDEFNNIIAEGVSAKDIISGVSYTVDDAVTMITLESVGKCKAKKTISISTLDVVQLANITYKQTRTACLWRHLKNPVIYNYFYGNIEPYIIEYPLHILITMKFYRT